MLVSLPLCLSIFFPAPEAADKAQGELFETIARMDREIFDAFNQHDVARVMSLFTEDMEFYHDTSGLSNYTENAESFKKMFASTPDIRRDLEPGSLQVYPIKDHGAIEIGRHRFCYKENRMDGCGRFGFAMVWRKTGGSWKISRVLSFRSSTSEVAAPRPAAGDRDPCRPTAQPTQRAKRRNCHDRTRRL